jgi:hypothetical protein
MFFSVALDLFFLILANLQYFTMESILIERQEQFIRLPATPNSTSLELRRKLQSQPVWFVYTGLVQTFTVPIDVSVITVDISGSAGGPSTSYGRRGYGARVQATLPVIPGETLNVYIGSTENWNGGGLGDTPGGDASDIRRGGTTLYHRIIIAGGGGGNYHDICGSGSKVGGDGGETGGAGADGIGCSGAGLGGGGGTSFSGGSAGGTGATGGGLGYGGNCCLNCGGGGGGGGGGYYGGTCYAIVTNPFLSL